MKGFWFRLRAKQILAEMEPEATFSFCNGWFDRFKVRHKISLRRATNVAQGQQIIIGRPFKDFILAFDKLVLSNHKPFIDVAIFLGSY